MIMSQVIQFAKQLSGRLGANDYHSLPNASDPGKVAYLRNLQRELKNKDVLSIPFSDLKVVVFDLETTGFYPYKGDKILSIGAIRMQGEKVLEEETFYAPVYNEEPLSAEIETLTGISGEELLQARPLQEVLKSFYQFIKSDTLVAHHSTHEKQFMKHATWSALKTSFMHRIVDTAFLIKVTEPEARLVTLDECCEHYGIMIEQRHHALSDAIATARLWSESIQVIQEMGFSNLKDVYAEIASWK